MRAARVRFALFPLLAVASIMFAAGLTAGPVPLSVRITSPLGRMGTSGKVRIVGQIQAAPGTTIRPVRFFVDGKLIGQDDDGPPYAVEWLDENPYERREIEIEVEDDVGHVVRDSVVLEPFEIVEVTGVSRVLLEAGVYDKQGHFVGGLTPSSFRVIEDGVAQEIDLVNQETLPATFALLIDSSQSMSRRIDFVRDAAGRFVKIPSPERPSAGRSIHARSGRVDGPDGRSQHGAGGGQPHRRCGRDGDS